MGRTNFLQLPATTGLSGAEFFPVVQGGTDKKATVSQLVQFDAGSGTQTANTVYAGPTTAPAAAPDFRALVSADLPSSPTLTTPDIGVATGTSLTATGLIKSSGTAGVGYASGAGGAVTQSTSKSTGVTLSKITGQITMNNASLASDTTVSFTLTNTTIASTDLLVLNHISGGTAGSYLLNAQASSGSASINVRNITGGSLSEAIVIAFAVIKAVTS